MIGAIVLFQVVSTVPPAPEATPRPTVVARSVDLSTVASRVHVNREALDGWVPRKGVPAPEEPPPARYEPSPPPPARRDREEPYEEPEPAVDTEDSVNAFGSPHVPFYGSYGGYGFYGRPFQQPPVARSFHRGPGPRDSGHMQRRPVQPRPPMPAPRMWRAGRY